MATTTLLPPRDSQADTRLADDLGQADAHLLSPLPAGGRRSPTASIVRGAMALLSTQPLTWAATLLTTVLVPRYLGDTGFGQYSMALTVAGLAGLTAALGVPGYLPRRIAIRPASAMADVGAALVLLVGVAAVVAAGLAVGLPLLGLRLSEPHVLEIALAGMVVTTAQSVVFALLVGQERHARYAWLNAAGVVLAALGGVGALAAGGGIVALFAATVVASALVTAVSAWSSGIRLRRQAFDPRLWRDLARGGFPFLGLNLAIRIRNQVDVILVGLLLGEHAAGWLAAAYRIVSIPVFIPTLITTPLLPALSRSAGNRPVFEETLRRSLAIVLIATVPLSALAIALAPAIPGLLHWDASFQRSVPLMMVLAVTQPIGAVDTVLATALFALQDERRWLRVAILGALFNPGINLLAIPLFDAWLHDGALGAALVEVATEFVMLAGALVLMPRGMLDRATTWMSLRVLVASACLAIPTMLLRDVSLPLAVAAGGLAFVATALPLRVLRLADLAAVHPRSAALATRVARRLRKAGLTSHLLGLWVRRHFQRAGIIVVFGGWPLPAVDNRGGRIEIENCALYSGVRLECWRGATIRIGKGTYLNRNTEVVAGGSVSIGRDCMIARDVIIMDTDQHPLPGRDLVVRPVEIQDRVWIGARAIILKGVTIGHDSIVGAGAVVTRSVPPHSIVVGPSARVLRTLEPPQAAGLEACA